VRQLSTHGFHGFIGFIVAGVASVALAAQPLSTDPAYVVRGRETAERQQELHARMERFHAALTSELRHAAPDLLPTLEPPPSIVTGYQLLPRIAPDVPHKLPAAPQVVRYSWGWSDILIARQMEAIDRLGADLSTARRVPSTPNRAAYEAIVADYKKIVDLQPVPPPQWVIAAGSRVGGMWGGFVKEFRAAPIPDKIKKDTELRNTYYASLDDASEPQKQMAKGAFKTCLDYSVQYQFFDEFSRACEEWLAQNYKNEFHLIDEFRGSPTHINDPLKEESYPLRLGGEPLIPDPKAAPPPKKEEKAAQ